MEVLNRDPLAEVVAALGLLEEALRRVEGEKHAKAFRGTMGGEDEARWAAALKGCDTALAVEDWPVLTCARAVVLSFSATTVRGGADVAPEALAVLRRWRELTGRPVFRVRFERLPAGREGWDRLFALDGLHQAWDEIATASGRLARSATTHRARVIAELRRFANAVLPAIAAAGGRPQQDPAAQALVRAVLPAAPSLCAMHHHFHGRLWEPAGLLAGALLGAARRHGLGAEERVCMLEAHVALLSEDGHPRRARLAPLLAMESIGAGEPTHAGVLSGTIAAQLAAEEDPLLTATYLQAGHWFVEATGKDLPHVPLDWWRKPLAQTKDSWISIMAAWPRRAVIGLIRRSGLFLREPLTNNVDARLVWRLGVAMAYSPRDSVRLLPEITGLLRLLQMQQYEEFVSLVVEMLQSPQSGRALDAMAALMVGLEELLPEAEFWEEARSVAGKKSESARRGLDARDIASGRAHLIAMLHNLQLPPYSPLHQLASWSRTVMLLCAVELDGQQELDGSPIPIHGARILRESVRRMYLGQRRTLMGLMAYLLWRCQSPGDGAWQELVPDQIAPAALSRSLATLSEVRRFLPPDPPLLACFDQEMGRLHGTLDERERWVAWESTLPGSLRESLRDATDLTAACQRQALEAVLASPGAVTALWREALAQLVDQASTGGGPASLAALASVLDALSGPERETLTRHADSLRAARTTRARLRAIEGILAFLQPNPVAEADSDAATGALLVRWLRSAVLLPARDEARDRLHNARFAKLLGAIACLLFLVVWATRFFIQESTSTLREELVAWSQKGPMQDADFAPSRTTRGGREGLAKGKFYSNDYTRSVAIVVGNEAGVAGLPGDAGKDLEGPVRDARQMRELLTSSQLGFTLVPVGGGDRPTRADIEKAFFDASAMIDANSRFLFFYAGHGWAEYDEHSYPLSFLLPSDTRVVNGDLVRQSAISASDLHAWTREHINCKHRAFILQSCHSGGLMSNGLTPELLNARVKWDGRGATNIYGPRESLKFPVFAVVAGGFGEIDDNTPFVRFLGEYLRKRGNRLTTLSEAMHYIEQRVEDQGEKAIIDPPIMGYWPPTQARDFILIYGKSN